MLDARGFDDDDDDDNNLASFQQLLWLPKLNREGKVGVPTLNEDDMFEFMDLDITHVYKIVTFLFEFMLDQRHRIHRVSKEIEESKM